MLRLWRCSTKQFHWHEINCGKAFSSLSQESLLGSLSNCTTEHFHNFKASNLRIDFSKSNKTRQSTDFEALTAAICSIGRQSTLAFCDMLWGFAAENFRRRNGYYRILKYTSQSQIYIYPYRTGKLCMFMRTPSLFFLGYTRIATSKKYRGFHPSKGSIHPAYYSCAQTHDFRSLLWWKNTW